MFRTLTGLIGTRDGPPRVAQRESPPEHPDAFLRGPADPGSYADIYLSNHETPSGRRATKNGRPWRTVGSRAKRCSAFLQSVGQEDGLSRDRPNEARYSALDPAQFLTGSGICEARTSGPAGFQGQPHTPGGSLMRSMPVQRATDVPYSAHRDAQGEKDRHASEKHHGHIHAQNHVERYAWLGSSLDRFCGVLVKEIYSLEEILPRAVRRKTLPGDLDCLPGLSCVCFPPGRFPGAKRSGRRRTFSPLSLQQGAA